MRILVVGEGERAAELAAELEAAGLEVSRWTEGPAPADGAAGIALLADALAALDAEIASEHPDAVLATSASDAALAAVIVATKSTTPVGVVEVAAGEMGGSNARVIHQLTDAVLAPDPAAIAGWVRDTYTARS